MSTPGTKEVIEIDTQELEALRRRVEAEALEPEDFATIDAVLESYAYVTHLIDKKSTTLDRLRKLLFGASTEKTADVVGRAPQAGAPETAVGDNQDGAPPARDASAPLDSQPAPPSESKQRRKGHGRNGAADYPGAERVGVRHEFLQPGDACPACLRGTAYEISAPGVLIRFRGQPPLQATIYELQKLRCHLCGQIFTAQPPAGVGPEKYDATVGSVIGLLKYGSGVPFNRLEGLQENAEVPLPASTQWEIVAEAAEKYRPAQDELIRQAAQGEVVYNDDTTVKILERMGARAKQQALGQADQEQNAGLPASARTGLFTSGVVATGAGRRIALFFSGNQHAGENLRDVLRKRAASLPPPIQMCDALSRNRPAELQTILANCLAHGRRQFVEVNERFPEPCRYVLEAIEVIYRNDATGRERQMTAEERLRFHQAESGPTMDRLQEWLKRQIDERLVEPQSALGAAIQYLRKHWEKLTLFLRVPGAPLDNNICERALKKAILHRKNALFYKTQNGADVGDLHMSLIHTCELCGANPFDYLTELQRHAEEVAAAPERWLPWNYRDAIQPC
jgi:transposase